MAPDPGASDQGKRTVACNFESLVPDETHKAAIRDAVQCTHRATILATELLNMQAACMPQLRSHLLDRAESGLRLNNVSFLALLRASKHFTIRVEFVHAQECPILRFFCHFPSAQKAHLRSGCGRIFARAECNVTLAASRGRGASLRRVVFPRWTR